MNGFQKVKLDFNLEGDDLKVVFRLSKTAATETFINSFQYKILNDIIYTNSSLSKIGYVQAIRVHFVECVVRQEITCFSCVLSLKSSGMNLQITGY